MPAIPVHHGPTSTAAWDGPANEARLKNDAGAATFRRAFAWVDPGEDADTKSAYSFIHHEVSSDGTVGPANMRACSSAIAVLNGGRMGPGASAPWSSDKAAIHRHLAAHMMDADMEPPPLRTSPPADIERRTYNLVELRVTPANEDDPPRITGYAAVFDELSVPIGGMFQEKLAPGAFRKALRGKPDVRALFNHDPNYVLGRTASKTLQLNQDDTGLAVEIIPPDTQWARDLMVSMQRGDVNQMSFGFRVGKDEWSPSNDGKMQIRTVLEVSELLDVSPVTFPAYPQTSVQARSALAEAGLNLDDLEAALLRLKAAGDSPADWDVDQIRAAIAALESALPRAAPIEPPDETWRIALANRRRRLELMKLAR